MCLWWELDEVDRLKATHTYLMFVDESAFLERNETLNAKACERSVVQISRVIVVIQAVIMAKAFVSCSECGAGDHLVCQHELYRVCRRCIECALGFVVVSSLIGPLGLHTRVHEHTQRRLVSLRATALRSAVAQGCKGRWHAPEA